MGRRRCRFAQCLGACLAGTLLSAQTQSGADLYGGPVRTEIDLRATDAGVFVPEGFGAGPEPLDGGAPGLALTPPQLVTPSPARYPEELSGSGLAGVVQLDLLVDEQGAVVEVAVAQGANPVLERAAVEAARKLGFKPATLDGKPVEVRLRYSYEFLAPAPPPPALATLAGEIRGKGTRAPIANATVLEGEKVVAQAAADGTFTAQLPPGTHALRVTAPDHRDAQFTEELAPGSETRVVYRLEALVSDPYVTVVRDERPRAEISKHSLVEQELHDVPGTMGDPFRVVMLMPGVGSVISGLSYPVVRGAQPSATGFFIDGVQVPFLYHLGIGSAVVHPDFIRQIDFYPSTAPVRYGRLLGGVVDAQTSRPRDDRFHASGYADLVNSGGLVETQIPQTGTNVTAGGRYAYAGWIAGGVMDALDMLTASNKPVIEGWDYQGRIEQRLPNGGRLRLLALGAFDRIGADQLQENALDVYVGELFHRIDLRYQQPLGRGELEGGFTWGHDELGIDADQSGPANVSSHLAEYKLRTNLLRGRASWSVQLSGGWDLSVGADIEHRRAANSLFAEMNTGVEGGVTFTPPLTLATLSGLYAQAQWRPHETLSVTAGLRGDLWHLVPRVDRASLDPRLSVRYSPRSNLTFKAGAAMVHQPPSVLLTVPVLDVAFLRDGLQEAITGELGTEWAPVPGFELSVDAYYSYLTRAHEIDLFQLLQNFRTSGLLGRRLSTWGRAYGVELMVRHPIGQNWFAWASYSLQRSTRYETFTRFDEAMRPIGRASAELPFAFDQTHVFNAALSYKFPRDFTAGVVVHFNTGRPESGKISSRTQVPWTNPVTGEPGWRPVNRDQIERLPPFFRVDVRVAKRWLFDDFSLEAYLDVLNASVSFEVLGYQYWPPVAGGIFTKEPARLPIVLPMLGLKGAY